MPAEIGQTEADGQGRARGDRASPSSTLEPRRRRERRQGRRPEPAPADAGAARTATSCSRSASRRRRRRTTTTTVRRPRRRDRDRDAVTGRARRAGTASNGRHDLPWRATRDRWTRARVGGDAAPDAGAARRARCSTRSSREFPTPAATAAAGPAAVITAWGRLGYPRRARWLWEAAVRIDERRLARRPHASCPASAATPRPRSPRRSTTPTASASR